MKYYLSSILLAFLILSSPLTAIGEEARIKNTMITSSRKDLIIYFSVAGSFTPKIEEAINSGIPAGFLYKIELVKKGGLANSTVASAEVSRSIKYDTLKKEYTISASERKEPLVTNDFNAAKNAMSRVDGFPLMPSNKLEKDAFYTVRIKAELDTIKLPPPLNYILFFASFWDFETSWEMMEFAY